MTQRDVQPVTALTFLFAQSTMSFRRDGIGLTVVTLISSVILLIGFWDPVFTANLDGLLGRGDSHIVNGPKGYFLDSRLRQGEFPLWDPMQNTGSPYVAHPLSLATYPPNLMRAFVADAETPAEYYYSVHWLLFAHFLISAWGVYLLCRRESISSVSSVLAALGVSFSERWVASGLTQWHMLYTLAWIPVILLLLNLSGSARNTRKRFAWALLAGIAYGLQILGGWTQAAVSATIGYCMYVAFQIVRNQCAGGMNGRGVARAAAQTIAVCAAFGICGALLSMAFTLPAIDIVQRSVRSTAHSGDYVNPYINTSTAELLRSTLGEAEDSLLAHLRAIVRSSQNWFSLAFGLLVVTSTSIILLKRSNVLVYFILAWVFLDLSIGPPFPISLLLAAFEPLRIGTPSYQAVLFSLPLGIIAGFALDRLFAAVLARRLGLSDRLVMLFVGVGLVALALDPNRYFVTWSIRDAVLPAVVIGVIVLAWPRRIWPWLVAAALLAEITLNTRAVVRFWTTSEARSSKYVFVVPYFGEWSDITTPSQNELRRPRIVAWFGNAHVFKMEAAMNGADALVPHEIFDSLCPPGEEGRYGSAVLMDGNVRELTLLRRPYWLARSFARGEPPDKLTPYPPTAVAFLDSEDPIAMPEIEPDQVPEAVVHRYADEKTLWPPGGSEASQLGQSPTVYLRDVELPARNCALRIYYSAATETIGIRLDAPGLRPYRPYTTGIVQVKPPQSGAGVVEFPLPDYGAVDVAVGVSVEEGTVPAGIVRLALVEDLSDESDKIQPLDSLANRVTLRLNELPESRILVFTEWYHPGWRASLDGTPVPIYRANGPYKAVIIPEGTHEVVFEFRPWDVYAGVTTSLVTLLCATIIITTLFMWKPAVHARELGPPRRE